MRRFLTGSALVAAAACTSVAVDDRPVPDYASQYLHNAQLLRYTRVDSAVGTDERLEWGRAPDTTYTGYTCVILIPNQPGATLGQFLFRIRGLNTGTLERWPYSIASPQPADIESLTAYFLPPGTGLGTGGSYAVGPAGEVTLTWQDGQASRYFAPGATLQITGDTLFADATNSFATGYADWHVAWTIVDDCP